MARRMRLYDAVSGRWGWYTVSYAKSPWERAWTGTRWLARHIRRHLRAYYRWRWGAERVWNFDPETLNLRDPKGERRMRRRDRRDRLFARAANALNAMVEMQKHIG